MKTLNQPNGNGAKKRRAIAALCAVVMLAVYVPMIGGTLAYLIDKTPELVNTFELGTLNYELTYKENKPKKADGSFTDGDVKEMPEPNPVTHSVAGAESVFMSDAPQLVGYEFQGWADTADAAEADYKKNDTTGKYEVTVEYDHNNYNNPDRYNKETATTRKEVYAVWQPNTYTVVYNNNVDPNNTNVTQPTGSTADSIHTYDVAENLTRNGFVRTGYTFVGWNTQPDGKGKSYADNESVLNLTTKHGDTITLYAQWGAKSYVIRYHANSGEGTMADQVITYDVPTTLSKNLFTKHDHTFGGWALTPEGEQEYIDEQIVVNLLETGVLDLYAIWLQDSHTLYFDYNGGTGSPASKQVQNGKAYGQLPEYPVHKTKEISQTEVMSYLFTGWYTAPTGGTRVYPSNIYKLTEDQILYAHWKEAPTNNVIQDIVVKNNPDNDNDGVVDDIYLNFMCSGNYEKYNIPLENLVKGQRYRLSFTESNNATYGMSEGGYKNAIYGFIITKVKTLTSGSIRDESELDGGLIKTFNDRYDGELNGPRNWSTTFVAEESTMYWTWDMGLIADTYPNGPARDYNFTNIRLEPVPPTIQFGNKTTLKATTSNAKIDSQNNGTYSTKFVFNGDGGCETVYWPITGLSAGLEYTITFDHKVTGGFVDANSTNYEYGCGIMNAIPTTGATMGSLGSWASATTVFKERNKVESVTLTFTATGDTAYWVWNMANCSDTDAYNCTIDVDVTKFGAKDSANRSVVYHDAPSTATSIATVLMMRPTELQPISLTYDISVDELTPFASDLPYASKDYIMSFTPVEGAAMPEYIRVEIDGKEYLYISADLPKGIDVDGNECYILLIDGGLLNNASTLYIEAIAETVGVTYVVDLPDVTVSGTENTAAGVDGVLTLTGENIPKILLIEMKDKLNLDGSIREPGMRYLTCLDEDFLYNTIKAWDATGKIGWLTENEDGSQTLTLPEGVMKDGEIITITGMDYEVVPLDEFTLDDLF